MYTKLSIWARGRRSDPCGSNTRDCGAYYHVPACFRVPTYPMSIFSSSKSEDELPIAIIDRQKTFINFCILP